MHTWPPTPFARLYNHLRFAAAALGGDARAGLHAAIQRLMRDVFIVSHGYLAPKVVPGAHEHDQVFRLLRTYAEYTHEKAATYAHVAGRAPIRGAAFPSHVRGAYHFTDLYAYELWSLQKNDHDYQTLRAYVCFLLGFYQIYA